MSLTTRDAKIIIGMILRGDNKHDIAAWFGVNQARIKEAEDGAYGTTEAAPTDQLPPKGAPGPKGRRLRSFVDKAIDALKAGDAQEALAHLTSGAQQYDRHE